MRIYTLFDGQNMSLKAATKAEGGMRGCKKKWEPRKYFERHIDGDRYYYDDDVPMSGFKLLTSFIAIQYVLF